MGIKRKLLIGLFAAFLVLQNFAYAYANEAVIDHMTITNTRDDLFLYLDVKGAFTEEMDKAVLSGVPTTFLFYVNIYKVRSLWMDNKINGLNISTTIKYNNLKKEFTVTNSWQNGKPKVTSSFQEAKNLMTRIKGLKIIPLSTLEKGAEYQIEAKAKLSKVKLPLYLHYILFFVSLWDFETSWHTINFTY